MCNLNHLAPCPRCVTALLLALFGVTHVAAVETVRVDAAAGAPRLLVDSQPVRARMFFGGPGTRPLVIGPAGQLVTFEFSPTQDEPRTATLHLRFGSVPGDVYLDDIRVTELDTGREVISGGDFAGGAKSFSENWTFWPTGKQNTVGEVQVEPGCGRDGSAGLHVGLKAPPDGDWPDFHIYHHANLALRRGARYRVELWVRAEPARTLTIAFYRPGQTFTYLGGPPSCFASQIKLSAAVGVPFVSFPLGMPWPRPGEDVDWNAIDAACQDVLDANPEALLLPRLGLDPPLWWRESHPDDVMVWDVGAPPHGGVVVGSPDYLHDAAERLTALIEHVEGRFGQRVAGYHPCGQNTGEWFYQDTWGPGLQGYARGDLRAWRTWLRER